MLNMFEKRDKFSEFTVQEGVFGTPRIDIKKGPFEEQQIQYGRSMKKYLHPENYKLFIKSISEIISKSLKQ